MTRCSTCGHDNPSGDLCAVCRRPLLPGARPAPAGYPGPHAPSLPGHPAGMEPMLPASAYSAVAFSELAAADGPPLGERWEKALAIGLPILALSMLLVHFAPAAMFV